MLIVSIFAMRMRFAYFSTTLDTVPQKKSLLVRSRNLLLSKGSYRDDSLRIMPLSPMKIPTMYFDYMHNVPHMYSKKKSSKKMVKVFFLFCFLLRRRTFGLVGRQSHHYLYYIGHLH